MIQLDFFPMSREEELELEFQELQKSCEKVRKKLFAQNGELTKMYIELHNEFEQLKRSMCKESNV